MKSKEEAQKKEDKGNKEVKAADSRGKELETEEVKDDEERNGIIPEDMDFKKFMGCGG